MRFLPRIVLSMVIMVLFGSYALCQTATPQLPAPPTGGSEVSPDQQSSRGGGRGFGRSHRNSGGDAGQYSMNFENADIASVARSLSLASNIPVVIDADLKGNITIISSRMVSLQEYYDVINAALGVRGYSMVGGLDAKVIRVIASKKAIVNTTAVISGRTINDGIADQDLVTQVLPLDFASSDNLRDQLRPLVSADEASIVSIASNNTLIITDHASNLKRLIEIIKRCDTDTTGLITVNVYHCQYASADSLVTSLNALFQPKTTTGQPGMPGGNRGGQGGPGGRGPGGQNAVDASLLNNGGLAALRGQITFASDPRTNQLVISATPDRITMVMEVVKQLDVDTLPEVNVRYFPLQYADAQATADQLNAMFEQPQGGSSGSAQGGRGGFFGGFGGGGAASTSTASAYAGLKRNVVVPDVRTNSLVVTATAQNMKAFEKILSELDTPNHLKDVTAVIPLKFAKASDLAASLTTLFRGSTTGIGGGGGRSGGIASIFGLANSSSSNSNSPLVQLQQITVVAEPKTNSLLVTGPPSASGLVQQIVEKLDKRTQQVFIEAAIVDVTLDKDTQFGLEWQWHDGDNAASQTFNTTTDLGKTNSSGIPLLTPGSGLKYSILNNNLQVLLHALQTKNNVKVLSTPTITTADNVQAKISIGQDVPVLNSTLTSGGNQINSVTYQNVSIALTVTPHVNGESDVIGLDVHQLINEIVGTDPVTGAPIIADREALTTITVKDGQTIVIGGIIQDSKTKQNKAIPLLSQIPLIGNLFKSSDIRNQRTELMVFLTPRILKNDTDVQNVTTGTEKRLGTPPPTGTATEGRTVTPAL